MQRISITNPQNIIDGTAKKYYFKLRNTGGPKGDKGEKGDTGATGPQGPQGDPCTVVVNSTATLEPGSNAYVTNTGSLSNAVLNFGIPKGDRGPQGAKGDKGDTGAQGETGPRGPQGEKGTNATVYVGTTSTLAPGSQATVYNSGSDSNAVLNFGIPQGAKGDTGNRGPQGPIGPAGQNFTPTIVNELPATGDSSKLYLTPKAHTTQTATGNPITATITDGAGSMESFQLDGDTYQQSYTGKNLYNATTTETTTQGLTYSGDTGFIYLNGSRTGDGSINWANASLPAGTYKLMLQLVSGSIASTSNGGLFYVYGDNITLSPSQLLLSPSNPKGSITLTVSESTTNAHLNSWARKTETYSNAVIRYQIVSGTADDYDFEPYVGGTPSPNPDYPQPIQTVAGEQTVEIQGKNLFNKDKALDNYFYTSTGSKSTYSKAQFYNNNFVPTSNEITMSFSAAHDRQNGSNIEANVRIVQYDASGNFISRLMSRDNGHTFTLDTNTKSFILSIDNGPDAWFDDLQVEYGSTATAYAPYSKQTLSINLGKNLFNKDSYGLLPGYLNSTSGKIEATEVGASRTVYIPCEPNTTYTASKVNSGSNPRFCVFDTKELPANGVSALGYAGTPRGLNTDTSLTYTTKSTAKYLCVFVKAASTEATLDSILATLQIEAGSQATTYAPYFTPIELCKLGTYQDYIYENEGKWYLRKECGKKNLLSTEVNMFELSEQSGYSRLYISKSSIGMPTGWGSGIALCSNFKEITTGQATTPGLFRLNVNGNNAAFYIPSSITTLDAAKSYMDGLSGSVICYALATPTDTAITDSTLIAQLEAIRTASLGNGANTITNSATGSNLAGDMEIGYYGYNPTNRYDKFIWLDINNNYEQIGS